MKKTLFLCLTLLFSAQIIGQNACEEMAKLNEPSKYANRTSRMQTKVNSINQTMVMERDKQGNMRQTMSMNMMGNNMNIEMRIIDSTIYQRKNDDEWTSQPMNKAQIEAIKNQVQNGQLQFFKNCEKLPDEMIDGKKYKAFFADFDPEKMVEMMEKGGTPMPNAEMMKTMQMKMTMFYDEKGDMTKAKIVMNMMGQSIETDMDIEYDAVIEKIVPPPPPAPKKD